VHAYEYQRAYLELLMRLAQGSGDVLAPLLGTVHSIF